MVLLSIVMTVEGGNVTITLAEVEVEAEAEEGAIKGSLIGIR